MDWKPHRDRKGRVPRSASRRHNLWPRPFLSAFWRYGFLFQVLGLLAGGPHSAAATKTLTSAAAAFLPSGSEPHPPEHPLWPDDLGENREHWYDNSWQLAQHDPDGSVGAQPNQIDVSVSVLAAEYATARLSISHVGETLGDKFLEAIKAHWQNQPYDGELVYVVPQLDQEGIHTVLLPHWVPTSDKAVLVFDLSHWGAPIFARIDWSRVDYRDLVGVADTIADGPWEVYFAGRPDPIRPGSVTFAFSGAVFKFMPLRLRPEWGPAAGPLCAVPTAPQGARMPTEFEVESSKCLVIARETLKLFPHEQEEVLKTYVANVFCTRPELMSLGQPGPDSPLQDYVHSGYKVSGIFGFQDRSPEVRTTVRLGAFLFIDARQIGLSPSFLFLADGWTAIQPILQYLGVRQPQGFEFEVEGLPHRDNEVFITDGCTLVVRFVRDSTVALQQQAFQPGTNLHSDLQNFAGGTPVGCRLDGAPLPSEGTPTIILEHRRNLAAEEPIQGRPDPTEPIRPILTREQPDNPPPPEFIGAGFLVLAPRYRAEVVPIILRAPCTIEEALNELSEARAEDESIGKDALILPAYQPDQSFAVVLAMPDWADNVLCALIDARQIDGKLFACVLPSSLNRASLHHHIGIPDAPGLRVYVDGVLGNPDQVLHFHSGSVVYLAQQGRGAPRTYQLEDMLRSSRNWTRPCPTFPGPEASAFCVLTDGGTLRLVPTAAIDTLSPERLREFLADKLQFSLDRTTTCLTTPCLHNIAILGQDCHNAIVATEAVSRLPIPPGRWLPPQRIVFLDKRPILQDISWQLAEEGIVNIDRIIASLSDFAPEGFSVVVRDRRTGNPHTSHAVRVEQGAILIIEYILHFAEASAESEADEGTLPDDSSTDAIVTVIFLNSSGEAENEATTHGADRGRLRTDRSRSPRGGGTDQAATRLQAVDRLSLALASIKHISYGKYSFISGVYCDFPPAPHSLLQEAREVKLLSEPAAGNVSDERRIRTARTNTLRLGEERPYLPDGEPPGVPLPGDPLYTATAV